MKTLIFSSVLILLSISSLSSCLSLDPVKDRMIDNLVNGLFIPFHQVTGMSLSVALDGETVLSKGYGKMDIENGFDSGNDTLFSIGSITKSIVGTLVVKTLSEKYPNFGKTILDVPLKFLLPNFNLTFSDRFRTEQTTFRDLLSHRTCLSDAGSELIFGTIPSNVEYNYRTRYQIQNCGHRGGFLYNNALYALTGDLIAHIAGKSFDELVRSFMLEIGMTKSTIIDTEGSYEDLPNMSQGYYRKDGQIHKYNIKLLKRIDIGTGAGGVLSTSTDIAAYMNFHLNKGKVGDKQIVSEEAMSWMYVPAIQLPYLQGRQSDSDGVTGTYAYGLGLMLSLYNGYSMISHGGYWPPYQSEMLLFPSKNIGVFLVTNGPGSLSGLTPAVIGTAIFDIITGNFPGTKINHKLQTPLPFPSFDVEHVIRTRQEWLKRSFSLTKEQMEMETKIEFEDAIGLYGNELSGDLTIALDDQDNTFLQVNMGEWGIGRLVAVSGSDTKFLVLWKTDIMHHFYTYPEDIMPPPVVHMDFRTNMVNMIVDDVISASFRRNATVGTFPVIPFPPMSCGPQ